MHVHILGICGTFMGGIAAIAKAAGHRVTGSDKNVYPPMSTQLEALGIELIQGFEAAQLKPRPDVVVVGNVMTRGVPVIEALLDSGIPYASGPEWLAREVLRDVHVLGVAGTHGKTTTSSMLAWILEYAGLKPGFLIGGVPGNFGESARLGGTSASGKKYFVIEADEYDTAFFDKRAKFVHYRSRTLILNNLEFDHADIYENLGAIQKQFHHLVRTVPASGLHPVECQRCQSRRDARDGRVDAARSICAPGWPGHHLVAGPARRRRLLQVRGARRRAADGHGALGLVRRAQRRECAGRDRGRTACGCVRVAVHRGAGRVQGCQATHGTAWRSCAASRCTTISRITPRPSPTPSMGCGAKSATNASSPCSNRARPR